MAGREGLIDTAVKTSRSGYVPFFWTDNQKNASVITNLAVGLSPKTPIMVVLAGSDVTFRIVWDS